jgi:hypothetical protein
VKRYLKARDSTLIDDSYRWSKRPKKARKGSG